MPEVTDALVSLFDFAEGGGLFNDADLLILSAQFVRWDWKKKDGSASGAEPSLALHLKVRAEDQKEYDQYLGAGKLDSFVPSTDGKSIVKVGKYDKIMANCDYARFMASAINNGLDAASIGSDISKLAGTTVHVVQQVTGKGKKKDGGDYVSMVVNAVTPGDGTIPAAAGSKPATASKKGAAVSEATSQLATDTAIAVLADKGGIQKIKTVATAAFSRLSKSDDKAESSNVSKLLNDPAFLQAGMDAGNWLYDSEGGTLESA